MIELASNLLGDIYQAIASPSLRISPVYLLVTLVIAAFLHRQRRIKGSLFGWLLPRSIYFHPSHIVDIKVFFAGRLIAALGLLQFVAITSLLAAEIAELGPESALTDPVNPFVVALLLLAVTDFCTYWVHRMHHQSRIIWPFHALHHSAEVLTPMTVFRKHPIYDLISKLVKAILIGVAQGGLLLLVGQEPHLATIAGVNLFYVAFHLAGSNLRHSHVWLSFGPIAERIFISPAQHQIHHSRHPRHHNKNYGEVLAIWDWMFGTLYVPQGEEELEFGLADRDGVPLPQRHTGLASAFLVPVMDSAREIGSVLGFKSSNQTDGPETAPFQSDEFDLAQAKHPAE